MRHLLSHFIRSTVIWFTSVCLVTVQTPALAQPHIEGTAAGQGANAATRSQITTSVASELVPGYTKSPPESAYYLRPNLSSLASEQLAACALTPTDPVCQAQLGAVSSANTPRDLVSPYDPLVVAARRIAANPASTLEDIASYYSGCQVDTVTTPATETRVCRQYSTSAQQSCASSLNVSITRTTNCAPGDWFAHAQSGATGLDAQCVPDRAASNQHFRITSNGTPLAFFDVDMTTSRAFPRKVAALPDNGLGFADGPNGVWVADNQCMGDNCQLTAMVANDYRSSCSGEFGREGTEVTCTTEVPFVTLFSACPAGTVSGNYIVSRSGTRDDGFVDTTLDGLTCFVPSAAFTPYTGYDTTGALGGYFWAVSSQRVAAGWQINPAYGPVPRMTLSYERAHSSAVATDQWNDLCPTTTTTTTTAARCTALGAPRCVDGPATKAVDGVPVTRACWRYETPLSCTQAAGTDECAPLVASGCASVGTACRQTNVVTGACEVTENTYSCPVAPSPKAAISNCPADVFCVAGSCFNTSSAKDSDFARAMSFMEAAREAGTYLDTDNLQVFKGEGNSCRDRLFKDCCESDSAGKGMSNQSLMGAGSRLVFDILMNADNRDFLYQGMSALLTSGGFSGSFTSYGVTVAVNGTALPAGSAVLFSGESVVIAFDPWSLAIAVVMYAVTSLASCNEGEAKLAMKEGAGLCHAIGSYCSSCIRILGHCVSCIEHTTGKCCFNSVLARVINEQGRVQFAKGWGGPKSPDCSGFTVPQLQNLDFSSMDLSEFYASIVPKLPNTGAIQDANTNRAIHCYYGTGKCQ